MVVQTTPKNDKKTMPFKSPQSSNKKKLKQASLLSFFNRNKAAASSPARNAGHQSLFVDNDDNTDMDSGFVTAMEDTANHSITPLTDTSVTEGTEEPTTFLAQSEEKTNKAIVSGEIESENTGVPTIEKDEKSDKNAISNEPSERDGSPDRPTKRHISYAESSDEEDGEVKGLKTSKKKRRQLSSDDEEEEYVPQDQPSGSEQEGDEDDDVDSNASEAKNELNATNVSEDDDDDDDILKLSNVKPRPSVKDKAKPTQSPISRQQPLRRPSPKMSSPNKGKHSSFTKENEERYQWLVDERDAQGRACDDPDYDPRTLYIPSSAWSKFTPFEKQYWEIKSRMWDCIVFFKKGKFFEMYEKDAMLGNHLFDLKIAGGGRANMRLAGVPEMSFDYWAMQFIQNGYKVAKVDQRESMLAKEMRDGNKGIVKRELQSVLTSGTLTDSGMLQSDQATFCLAIREEPLNFYDVDNGIESSQSEGKIFGVAFIDTATGEIELLEFEDDNECTKLDTVLSQVRPKEVIMEKNNLSSLATKTVKYNAQPQAILNNLKSKDEFYDFNRTFDELTSTDSPYFPDMDHWPEVLTKYYEQGKKVGFSAFGGLLSYLKWLKLDQSLISMRNIKEYNPIRSQTSLVLDGVTLQNLEIFGNSFDNSDKGTLFKVINRAITPMGKRMLKKWVIHPLLQKYDIDQRFDSVDLLLNNIDLREILEGSLSSLPDLERLLARIHSGNLRIKDFNKVIEGFEVIVTLKEKIMEHNLAGTLIDFVNKIPDTLSNCVSSWCNAFDRRKAEEEGVIIPQHGVDIDFDQSLQKIESVENELTNHLRSYKKTFKTQNIQYKDSGKEIFTIEVPTSASSLIPSDWIQMGANKSSKRYYSPEVSKLARSMAEARELHKVLEESVKSRLYQKFDTNYQDIWMPTISAISEMDCILSLARTSESLGYPCCRPKFVDETDPTTGNKLNGFVDFKDLRHPCFNLGTSTTKDFIPNDVSLGGGSHQVGLLTGANAAGKSTVLRMTCIAVIMAQIGCYVPAESAALSPIDRIMTRLGANDNIMQGKSTFFVELSETKKILDASTNRSLLILDELGRGGSSSDGFAIAESVLHHVATHIQSLGFFATHYGGLGLGFKHHPKVVPLKMEILVDESSREITFLYKLVPGQSEGSFGMHVASMCGIAKSIVNIAQIAADNQEHTSLLIKERQKAASGMDEKSMIPLGLQSDFVRLTYGDGLVASAKGCGEGVTFYDNRIKANALKSIFAMIDGLE
ncbi:LANO_0C05600g1_1 [Lachancea nothofagi CBS 11611]|uniref:DNA mismatch repair protein n=1 Tax=Lachancea nothofagi CBS 11611 TaxID=1266666 RepID=A0A1G4J7I4_9SACH|nr:LANO_0C05600g1_1 [Lachancea nothofagi CBS 11611]